MLPRYIIQYVISASTALGRAVRRAVSEQLKHERVASSTGTAKDERRAAKETEANVTYGLTLNEAVQILNVSKKLDPEEIQENYEHLFAVNDKKKGGSFYLQSKVYRAKERLDAELEARGIKAIKPDEVIDADNSPPSVDKTKKR